MLKTTAPVCTTLMLQARCVAADTTPNRGKQGELTILYLSSLWSCALSSLLLTTVMTFFLSFALQQ